MRVEKGQKVFFIETKNDQIVKREWTTVTRTDVCIEDWDCWTDICLDNGRNIGSGDKTNKELIVFNECNGTCWLISDNEENAIEGFNEVLEQRKVQLNEQIKSVEKRISEYANLQMQLR